MLEVLFNKLGYQKRGLSSPSAELRALFGAAPGAAGVSVTAQTALNSTTFLAATRVLSETIGTLPIHVFRRAGDDRERLRDDPVVRLLAGAWTPWLHANEARIAMQMDAILHGFAIAQVVRVRNEPRELHRLDPTSITIEVDTDTGAPSFKVRQTNGTSRVLAWQEVLFVCTPGWTLDRPLCLLDKCREAVAIDLSMQARQATYLGNSTSLSGKLMMPDGMSPERAKEMAQAFAAAHSGPRKAGGVLSLFGGATFEEADPFNFSDAQFLELRRFVVAEIARALKVPQPLVGDLERAVWNNVTELNRQFLVMGLSPWLKVWEGALTRTLLTPDQQQNTFIEFQTADLLRSDVAARFAAYRNAIGGSWLTPNEARRMENKAPVEGGDELILQAGQTGAADPDDDNTDDATRNLRLVP